ncbi:MAG TPA: homoserine dehydrogenase [Actinomycetota bacterium]
MGERMRVGLLGCGNVGSAVVRMLHDHAEEIARRSGTEIEIVRIGVRDPRRPRDVPVDSDRFTADLRALVADRDVDVIVELLGGVEPARSLMLAAFSGGKPVVTANKELLASHSLELFRAAAEGGVDVLYEASVGGGIPLIRPLREGLAGDRIGRFMGIVNGTTNYVLTRMAEEGLDLDEAVAEAQSLGYAEADPSADIDGHDAAAKAAILATIAFDLPVVASDVYREGIREVSAEDIAYARGLGYTVKLLVIGESDDGEVSVRVYPAMIPSEHPLASVRESFNAVYLEGQKVGPLMLYGRGAGGDPTATSVVGDLIELARNRVAGLGYGAPLVAHTPERPRGRIKPIEELSAQYYILLRVADRPGVLAAIAGSFAEHDVSIKSVRQEGHGDQAQLVLITHRAAEGSLRACVRDLGGLEPVQSVMSVLRVEAAEP